MIRLFIKDMIKTIQKGSPIEVKVVAVKNKFRVIFDKSDPLN